MLYISVLTAEARSIAIVLKIEAQLEIVRYITFYILFFIAEKFNIFFKFLAL